MREPGVTIPSTGAGLARFHKWSINFPGPVTGNVLSDTKMPTYQSRLSPNGLAPYLGRASDLIHCDDIDSLPNMSSSTPRWVFLLIITLTGCGDDATVFSKASKAGSRQLTPVEFDALEFTHDLLAERVRRIDILVRKIGLPSENTIDWSRRSPNESDDRKLPSYVAQWSSHPMRFGDAIQPDQRPGQKICIIADVNPEDIKAIRGFYLSADCTADEGWNASIMLFSFQASQRDHVGQEKLRIWLRHADEIARFSWPFSEWGAEVPTDPLSAPRTGSVVSIQATRQAPNLEQPATLFASPASFLNAMRRDLDSMERRTLDDIAASRNIRLGSYQYTTSIPDPSRMEFRDIEIPAGFKLTAGQKQALTASLVDWTQSRRKLLEEHYEDMHAAITKAFPLDEYFAAEANAETPVIKPRK